MKVLREQLKLLSIGTLCILVSLIGIAIFIKMGKYLIHPYLYLIMLIAGIGLFLTALFSIKNN